MMRYSEEYQKTKSETVMDDSITNTKKPEPLLFLRSNTKITKAGSTGNLIIILCCLS